MTRVAARDLKTTERELKDRRVQVRGGRGGKRDSKMDKAYFFIIAG